MQTCSLAAKAGYYGHWSGVDSQGARHYQRLLPTVTSHRQSLVTKIAQRCHILADPPIIGTKLKIPDSRRYMTLKIVLRSLNDDIRGYGDLIVNLRGFERQRFVHRASDGGIFGIIFVSTIASYNVDSWSRIPAIRLGCSSTKRWSIEQRSLFVLFTTSKPATESHYLPRELLQASWRFSMLCHMFSSKAATSASARLFV